MSLVDAVINRLSSSETQQKILRNLFWAVAGKATQLLGTLLVGILVARYLGPDQYGLMSYVVSYVALFQIFASFGLDSIEIREEAKHRDERDVLVGTAFYVKLMLAFVTILLCVLTSLAMESDSLVTWMVAIYALSMVARTFNVVRNFFMAIVDNELVVKSEIAATVVGAALKMALLLFHFNVVWFVGATMVDLFILAAGYVLSYKMRIGGVGQWRFSCEKALFLLKEAFPLMLTNAAVIVYQRIDQVMIGRMLDNASVGYFSVASRIVDVLIYVPFILADTIIPVLVAKREQSEELYSQKAQLFMNVAFWLTLLLAILTSLSSGLVMVCLFGGKYQASVPVLQLLAFKSAAMALSSCAGRMLIIEGLQRWAIFRDLLGCVVCITLNFILLPRYGVTAAAITAILSVLTAGYFADALIPAYRHLFVRQSKALFFGWRDLAHLKNLRK